jgi:hypothetical protein
MLDLLSVDHRNLAKRRIWELMENGALPAASAAVEELALQSQDSELIAAARASSADLDWAVVRAEAVAADRDLSALGTLGCRIVVLSLGNLSDRLLDVIRRYHAPDRAAGYQRPGRLAPPGGYHALLHGPQLLVTGLERLAELQLSPYPDHRAPPVAREEHARRAMLAGHLIVLRYLAAVQRRAGAEGFPFPAFLRAGVETIGGDEAIRQLEPVLEVTLAVPER